METTRLEAMMWRITRVDGVVIGVTDHDRDIAIGDEIYHARGALKPSKLESEMGLSPENLDVFGGVDGEIFREDELHRGLFDGALVEYFSWDWQNETKNEILLKGRIAKIEYSQNRFRAELETPIDKLPNIFGRSFQKECHACFCDENCGLNAQNFQHRSSIAALHWPKLTLSGHFPWPLENGLLVFSERPKGVQKSGIRSAKPQEAQTEITLWADLKFQPEIGETVMVQAGCDKNFETCRQRFGNAVNFRGFPHMPGEQVLNEVASANGSSGRGIFKRG